MAQIVWKNQPLPSFRDSVLANASAGRMITEGLGTIANVFNKRADRNILEAEERTQAGIDNLRAQALSYTNQDELQANRDTFLNNPDLDGTGRMQVAQTFQDQFQNLTPEETEYQFKEMAIGNNQEQNVAFDPRDGSTNLLGLPNDIRAEKTVNQFGGGLTAAIRDYKFKNGLATPEEQEDFMRMKRADQQLNLGNEFLNAGTGERNTINYEQPAFDKKRGTTNAEFMNTFDDDFIVAESNIEGSNATLKTIDDLLGNTNYSTTGVSGVASFLPNLDSKAFANDVESVKSALMLATAQRVGNVLSPISDTDSEKLSNKITNIDPWASPKVTAKKLKEARDFFKKMSIKDNRKLANMHRRYKGINGKDYQVIQPKSEPATTSPTYSNDDEAEYQQLLQQGYK